MNAARTRNAARIRRGLIFLLLLLPRTASAQTSIEPESGRGTVKPIAVTDRIPFGREPIDYFNTRNDDAVARWNDRKQPSGTFTPDRFGYLTAVLKEFDIPVESQLLVYSKTARTPDLISPRKPRAIFFNEEISVAWIPDAPELEISAMDPLKGVSFYTLPQPVAGIEMSEPLRFERREQCLACHAGRSSLEVPGYLLRSWLTDSTGKPLNGFSRVTHDLAFENRWGGWFVTGTPPGLIHRGNLIGETDNERHAREPGWTSALTRLDDRFDISRYPVSTSDAVAHLVLQHQMHGLNLLIRCGMEERLGLRSDVEEQLLRYLLFADEPPLPVPFSDPRTSAFANWFERRGRKDGEGRSLRQFDLQSRLQKYRLSWLVTHRLFETLPAACRQRLLRRLHAGLTAGVPAEPFTHLPVEERKAITAIVRATIPVLPACWQ